MQLQAASYQPVPHQLYQSGQFHYVYQHVEEKEVYRIDDDPFSEVNKDPREGKTYYINKSYSKLQINFVRIKLI